LDWIDVGAIAKDQNLFESYDSTYGCHVLNEDKLLDEIEDQMDDGGKVVDYHGCDFFPKRYFDAVFILRTENTVLYDRLVARGYSGKKLQDNLQCEIFQTILDEARDSYNPRIVFEIQSNTTADMEANFQKIVQWINQFKQTHDVMLQ